MLKKLALMLAAAFVFIPAASAQVSIDTPVLDVNLGVPSVDVDMDSEERIITYPAVTTGAAVCPQVITQPAVVAPVQRYTVLEQPAVTTTSLSCPAVIEQSAVVAPRMYSFLVPAPRTNVDLDDDDGLGILNPLNWFDAIF